jgi:uncharacterized RDD family membrane protein YckC
MRYDIYGGFFRRTVAFIIDCVLVSILVHLIYLMCAGVLGIFFEEETIQLDARFAESVLSYLLLFIYFVYFYGSIGQTPGKKLLDLKVIDESGEPVGFATAFLRTVGYLLSSTFFFIGFIWVIFDSKKQGWHDKIAGTYVVRARKYDEAQWESSKQTAGKLQDDLPKPETYKND